MKAQSFDADVLQALGPFDVAAYLRSRHWQMVDQIGVKGAVWTATLADGDEAELLLPLDRTLGDYAVRMTEALQTLEVAENRSPLEILHDIQDTTADVVRVHLQSPAFEDGSVPLEQAAHILQSAREMMLAAACAAVQPRSLFGGRKPAQAMNYMEKVRLGQTERGSYVLAIRSLVPPRLTREASLFPELAPTDQPPFERQVTLTLARALDSTLQALSQAAMRGDLSAFQEAAPDGVSANLCESLAGLGEADGTQEVSVSVNWSPARPVPRDTPSGIRLSSDRLIILREAGRSLRETAAYSDFELRGIVTALRRNEGELTGQITVAAVVDGQMRKVNVELFGRDYDLAIEAHQHERPLVCEGELSKEGRSYLLRSPRNLAVGVDA